MDPVTAFSIACGTIQVVDFAFKITRKVWMIVQSSSGTSTEYEELEAATSTLQDLMKALKTQNEPTTLRHTARAMQDPGDVVISSSTAQAMRQIASQCDETARKLIELLSEIKVDPTKYKSTSLRTLKTIKAIPKFYKISKLESQLVGYREKLEEHIILDLRQTSRALLSGTIQGFQDLRAEHKVIVAAIANNESRIAKLITAESGKIRGDIAAVGKKLDDAEYKKKLQMFKKSFAFEDMFEREERMSRQQAAPKTFRWLFDKNYSAQRPYDSFTDWLEGDQSIYWICGKAGSGKSTLVSFIWDHPDSKMNEYLLKWSANNELITAAVFFWHQGSQLQKSSAGLLRSLLYQILQQNESRASKLMELPNISQGANQPWSEVRLLPLLMSVLDEPDIRVCLFIDGLDEYGDGDVIANNSLLKVIFNLTAHANGRLKCCLSSRPLRSFELGLEKYSKLMLHKLTRPDITCYVADSLGDAADRFLIWSTVNKANGVFLWAVFAVKSLQAAQINGDTSDQVQQRLDEFPSELNDLYSHMLLKIDRVYWREAALYFALADYSNSYKLSVVLYVLASKDNYFEELTLPWTRKRIRALRQDCANMEKWLKVRTGGLLEVEFLNYGSFNGKPTYSSWEEEDDLSEDDLSKDDLSEDGAANDGVLESQVADGGEKGLLGIDASSADRAIFSDLLELRKDAELTSRTEAIVNGPCDEKAIQYLLFHSKVVSIHRSVTQFIRSEEQNEIFTLYSEGTALLKSIQADIVLFTFRDKFGFPMDDYITSDYLLTLMSRARCAEACTKNHNKLFIDELDRVLKTVKGPEWLASDPMHFATTFLGFTAKHGLDLYVQDSLKINPPTGQEKLKSVLNDALRCVTSNGLMSRQHLELTTFLLNEGANPNDVAPRRSFGNMTAWEAFLSLAVTELRVRFNVISEFCKVLELFVAHGADPHQEFVYISPIIRAPSWVKSGNQFFNYNLRANATFVLEQYGLPCDPAQSRAAAEGMVWRAHELDEETYAITPEGSIMLLEALVALLHTREYTPDYDLTVKDSYRRCLEVRKSAHDPDYVKPPLAEHYKGGREPRSDEEWRSDDSDESSEDGTLSHALAW